MTSQLGDQAFAFPLWVKFSSEGFLYGINQAAIVCIGAKRKDGNGEVLGGNLVFKVESKISAFIKVQILQKLSPGLWGGLLAGYFLGLSGGFFSYFFNASSNRRRIASERLLIRFSKRKSSRRFNNLLSATKIILGLSVGIGAK